VTRLKIKANTELGYYELERGGILDISFYSSKTRRGRIEQNGLICPTITTSSDLIIIDWTEPEK
jgi:hypothetical protein